jgi:hypothetical protein
MAKSISVADLGAAIAEELTLYSKDVQDKVNKAGRKAIKELERKTKDTAPFNAKVYHPHYTELIATKSEKSRIGDETHIWYVKPPGRRLTHLLVDGHETRDGGRTRGDPFLENATAAVLPDYENAVKEALTK